MYVQLELLRESIIFSKIFATTGKHGRHEVFLCSMVVLY